MSHDNLEILIRTKLLTRLGEPRKGEWVERRDGEFVLNGEAVPLRVVHIRRRMTRDEEAVVGPVRDLRGTRQEINRANAVGRQTNTDPRQLMGMT